MWTKKSFKNFVLKVDWRLKTDKGFMNKVPIILPDGSHKKDEKGKEIKLQIEDVDSGIYLRGSPTSQVNIWMWPVGSGEVYGYRMNKKLPKEVQAGVTPKKKMDRPRSEWNTFEITMKGDRLWVKPNGGKSSAMLSCRACRRKAPLHCNTTAAGTPRPASGAGRPVWCSSRISTLRNWSDGYRFIGSRFGANR